MHLISLWDKCFFMSETRKEIQMSNLKRILMKGKEITSDETVDLIKAAMRNRLFRVPLVQKRQHAHSL